MIRCVGGCVLNDEWCGGREHKKVCWWVCIKWMSRPRVNCPTKSLPLDVQLYWKKQGPKRVYSSV
jgi:hypothetical protein